MADKLERNYNSLKSEYDDCAKQAETIHKRIRDVETVATDLFAEWEKENAQIGTPSLQDSSRQQLDDTRQCDNELHTALKSAEQVMTRVRYSASRSLKVALPDPNCWWFSNLMRSSFSRSASFSFATLRTVVSSKRRMSLPPTRIRAKYGPLET